MSRPRPQEDFVREQLRDAADGAAASQEAAADPAPPVTPGDAGASAAALPSEALASEEGVAAPSGDDELSVASREREEYLRLAQRTQADFENFRKRAQRDSAAAGMRAKTALVRELLPVVDNLERALRSAKEGEESLAGGVRLVLGELEGMLQRNGVERIEAHQQPFDPKVHDALTTRAEEGADPGIVLEVVEKGYRLGEAVIRPARVVVSA